MNNISAKTLRRLRNFFILVGITGGFIIWLFAPPIFRNTPFFHVGNGEFGSKMGMLLLLPLPLFALIPQKERKEYHGTDMDFRVQAEEKENKRALSIQLVLAAGMSLVVILSMLISLVL